MNPGVSKSGSPAPKLTTSMPLAAICLALLVTAIVALGEIWLMRSDGSIAWGSLNRGDPPPGIK